MVVVVVVVGVVVVLVVFYCNYDIIMHQTHTHYYPYIHITN